MRVSEMAPASLPSWRQRMANSSPPKRERKSVGLQSRLQARRDGLDQIVAGLMAERVVDILEAIDIDIGGDGLPSVRSCCRDCARKLSIFSTIWARLGSPDKGSCLAS